MSLLMERQLMYDYLFAHTRSNAAFRATDLDWIIGPGYSLGGYILEKKNHENQPETMKN